MQTKVPRSTGPVRQARVSASALARHGLQISSQSLTQYHNRALSLRGRWTRETGETGTLADFAEWLLALKPTLKQSAFRLYRIAVTYWLTGQPDSAVAIAILDGDAAAGIPVPRADRFPLTSAAREKKLPHNHADMLVTHLTRFAGTTNALLAANTLQAGLLTGLRPDEWRCCSVFGTTLFVKSLKTDASKGLGPWRTMDLSGLPEDDLEFIQRVAEDWSAYEAGGTFDLRMRGAARALTLACRKIWPGHRGRRYCFYDTRHQAIANWKATMKPAEIAALAGHRVTRTATRSYATSRSAWSPTDRKAAPVAPAGVVAGIIENRREWSTKIFAAVQAPNTSARV